MSRAHGLNWKVCQKTVHTEDESRLPITILEVLDRKEMIALLQEELSAEGWKNNKKAVAKAEATLLVDGPELAVVVRAAQRGIVDVEAETQTEADRLGAEHEAALEKKQRTLVTTAILAAEEEVRENVQAAMQRTLIRALKQKAATMGTVESVTESGTGDNHEITIRVKAS